MSDTSVCVCVSRSCNIACSLPVSVTQSISVNHHSNSDGGDNEVTRTMLEIVNQLDGFEWLGGLWEGFFFKYIAVVCVFWY